MGIRTIAVVDTNTDPAGVDLVIPGNDDSTKASDLYLRLASEAILKGIQDGMKATGVDISKFAINKCLETMPSGNFLPIDILENNFSNEEFDAIVDAGAMHVNDPGLYRDFFKEYYRLLKPGKTCFIRVFNQLENTEKPIFFVYLRMPVYGSTVENIKNLITDLFDIEHIEYDPNYGMHGLGCNYFYLRKK